MLLLLIFEQAEPALLSKYSLLDNLSSQSKESCSTVAHSSRAGHTLTDDFTLGLLSTEMSKFQIGGNWWGGVGGHWTCYFCY